jgi:ribosomal protein S18 acetylase RimI-like enzyme
MAVIAAPSAILGKHLRPFDAGHDLPAVADLIELCFASTLDPDGENHLRNLREAANSASVMGWATAFGEPPSVPLTGYVWEEDGRLVGNVSVIPFYHHEHRYYLIANVAVHPEYRGRGIARSLTERGIEHARQRKVPAAWLQVRDDNDPAVHLYRALGFQERARRTTWRSGQQEDNTNPQTSSPFAIGPRLQQQWAQQSQWLEQV